MPAAPSGEASTGRTALTKIVGVAEKTPRPGALIEAFQQFEKAFDELFEDLLITRWRSGGRSAGRHPGMARVVELEDRYEVQIANVRAEPGQIEIEATERRLHVRISGAEGKLERMVDFHGLVDAELVSAHLEDGTLRITLPKKRARKVQVS